MVFNDPSIECEYERVAKENPDLEGINHPLINMSDTLKAYFCLADYFTDESSNTTESMLVGIRSTDLLYSALGRQTVSYAGHYKYTNPIDICSTLFFGMVKNHSFSDGNKRTALLVLLYQLDLYNCLPSASVDEFEKLVVAVAANTLSIQYSNAWNNYKKKPDSEVMTISHLLRKMTKKKDHSYHLKITMKDMVNALKTYGVICTPDGGKMHFERTIPAKWTRQEEVVKYTAVFGGWTRSIGASTARDVLRSLKLYDQFPDYQSFVDGNDPFYALIQDFESPLLRLKDE